MIWAAVCTPLCSGLGGRRDHRFILGKVALHLGDAALTLRLVSVGLALVVLLLGREPHIALPLAHDPIAPDILVDHRHARDVIGKHLLLLLQLELEDSIMPKAACRSLATRSLSSVALRPS